MKKVLVAAVVLAGVAVAFWWSQTPAPAPVQPAGTPAVAPGNAPGAAVSPLSAENSTNARVGTPAEAKPVPAAQPEAAAAPTPEPAPADGLRPEFYDSVAHLARADLLGYREKLRSNITERGAALRAERGGTPARTVYAEQGADAWTVALRNVPPGYIGFASTSGYDKEHGGEGFDLFLYPEDADPELANAWQELKWIEARLPNLPE